MQTQSNKLNFEGQKIFIGMDVHKKDWKVSIRSEELTYKTFTQKPSAIELVNHLHRIFPGAEYYSAYEAGFSGFWAHRDLLKRFYESGVVCPQTVLCDFESFTPARAFRHCAKLPPPLAVIRGR